MTRMFGTDGVRGLANREVTAELALGLAAAAARVLSERGELAGHRPHAVVGRDPRASGEFLAAATIASSTVSASLCPPREKNLMPLSAIGLCDAEIMTPRSASLSAVRNAIAGVGRTPAS